MALGDFHEAAVHLRKLTELNPLSAGAFNSLAFALLRGGQPEEALTALRKASQMDPNNATIHGETDAKGIYGESTAEEAKDLADEGIAFARIPWIPPTDG